MKFQIAINLERVDDSLGMLSVAQHTLDMVRIADQGGFGLIWSAEHHALEMTIAPNPFQILTWWAPYVKQARLGTAVAVAPYWHPINLAGEAAFTDLITGGRLEFGIGSGAYQREFDRMKPGLKQTEGYRYVQEMLPVLKKLWKGDYEHRGEFWSFPVSTSVPKPLQKPHPPVWVAARAPVSFDYAVEQECNIISWPLTRPFSEAELYKQRYDEALAAHSDCKAPILAMMRHASVYVSESERRRAIDSITRVLGQFENVFRNLGGVVNGFPEQVPLDELSGREQYNEGYLEENLIFGSPEQVIEKLMRYKELGIDEFIYYASMGLEHKQQIRSLEMFCERVIPEFT
ncbi:MAG: LLM class flavin-dependent oxidoreductase [Gammaproteobacteria bacterium]|nr:LLM class flavin-dependent oxidoreductase [Gammaproteobacteria bacterium]